MAAVDAEELSEGPAAWRIGADCERPHVEVNVDARGRRGGPGVTQERVEDQELADRLVRVTELTAIQAQSLVHRLDLDDAASRGAVIDYLERKEAGQKCRLQWITKDGRRVWARLLDGPDEN
jgi:hypothetical protein